MIDVLFPLVDWLIEGIETTPNDNSYLIDGIPNQPRDVSQKDIIDGDDIMGNHFFRRKLMKTEDDSFRIILSTAPRLGKPNRE